MKTYQDFLEVGQDEKARMQFILAEISEHKSSAAYQTACDAKKYYDGENPTITRYQKIIYDYMGKAHADTWTANHKIASNFFGFAVDQENSYLLGNGVTFNDPDTKEKLGTQTIPFDQQIMEAARDALIGGVSFCFWNLDHIEVYSITEYVPLFDEENGAMMAGIRFWQMDDTKPLRVTLFEVDGYTDYIRRAGEDMDVLRDKQAYITRVSGSAVDRTRGDMLYEYSNYPTFPIVPLMNNNDRRSELCGKRNTIDALDLATSNMVNNVDEGNLIYWVLQGAGGMDDLDDQQFLERLKTMRVVHTENGVQAEAHTIEAPFNGTQATIDMLIKRLYTDFQAFDASAITAGNQTATAINASYTPLDLKTDKFETQVTKAINGILQLAGITDKPTYTRNQIVNKQEEIQSVLLAAQHLSDEYITRKILTILGDADQAEDMLRQKDAETLERFGMYDRNGFNGSNDVERENMEAVDDGFDN